MRSVVPGLPSPKPLIELLPGVFQDDEFTGRFTAGLDEVLAPIFVTLDSLDAHVDPWVCPSDFLDWLATWVGVVLDENWPIDRRRALIANAVELFRMRGTRAGLQAEVEIMTGGTVEISETGGTAWSPTPGGAIPGEAVPRVAVRVTVPDASAVNVRALDALVTAGKPAHVVHRVEVVGGERS